MSKPVVEVTNPQLSIALKINRILFAPLVVIAFGMLFMDAAVYPGFVSKLVAIPSWLFMALAGLSYSILLFQSFWLNQQISEEAALVLRVNILGLPFLLIMFSIFSRLENANFDNYVFSTYHIHLPVLQQIVLFSLYLTVLYFLRSYSKIKLQRFTYQKGFPDITSREAAVVFVFGISIAYLVLTQMFAVLFPLAKSVRLALRNPFASYEDRRAQQFGPVYGTYQFIARHTEESAAIATPPQTKWGIIGNIGFSRYFLYPRYLFHPEDFTQETMPDFKYYIIAQPTTFGDDPTLVTWPSFKVKAESIFIYNEFTGEETKLETTEYDPLDPQYLGHWGIMKVADE